MHAEQAEAEPSKNSVAAYEKTHVLLNKQEKEIKEELKAVN